MHSVDSTESRQNKTNPIALILELRDFLKSIH